MTTRGVLRLVVVVGAIVIVVPGLAAAQESVRITTPSSVSFTVSNVNTDTAASSVQVSFDTLVVLSLRRLRISVMADSANFSSPAPASTLIPATRATWTTSNATGGAGSSGTLSSVAYTVMFDSQALALSGSVDVLWTLKAPGGGIRAGAHTLVVRYKVESF